MKNQYVNSLKYDCASGSWGNHHARNLVSYNNTYLNIYCGLRRSMRVV